MKKRPKRQPLPTYPDGTPVHPDVTAAELRQKWLLSAVFPEPETAEEFLRESLRILHEWYDRWSTLWKKVNPKALGSEEAKNAWLREQDLKAMAVYHAMRELKVYWKDAGVWRGNPYDPDDLGEFVLVKKSKKL